MACSTLDKWLEAKGKVVIIKSAYRGHSRHSAVTEWHIAFMNNHDRKLLEDALGKRIIGGEEIDRLYQLADEEGVTEYRYMSYYDSGYSYFPNKETLVKFLKEHGYEVMHISKARKLLKRLEKERGGGEY